ncbi:IS3 family transposase, partial [Corynebacterium sp.]|uniref:IS3 family transposase n=1 Tax=Corynebacterium sp. TaxID=1720 RepID=UPI002A9202C8
RPPTEVIVGFIDTYRDEFGVEPIIRALAATSAKIALSTYYAFKSGPTAARTIRDKQLTTEIRRLYEENYSCYGVRKMWAEINRENSCGHVARCTVERLMAAEGLTGITRRKTKPSTRSADADECPVDLVDRHFTAPTPNMLWVADITYIPTTRGWVYAVFVMDAYSREIVGWQITNHLRASLARDVLDMALSARLCAGEDVPGLIHHSDRGVQYRLVVYGEALAESKVVASVGSRGDSYDDAMAEGVNSLFKAELIDRRTWPSLAGVLVESSTWIGWYNNRRLHSSLGYRPPREVHQEWNMLQAHAA